MKVATRTLTLVRTLSVALLLASIPAVLTTTSAAAATCSVTWGSTQKAANHTSAGKLTNVRSGRNTCYDRLVLDVSGSGAGYVVRYVSNVVEESGAVVPLRGGAKLQIVAQVPAYTNTGTPTYNPPNRREAVNVAGYTTFRQVAWVGSFEGQSTVGLGVRARLPFRVLIIAGPGTGSRLAIDVAHHW